MNFLVEVKSLDEARVAEQAVLNHRKGLMSSAIGAVDDGAALAERIEGALAVSPLNPQKATVIRTLQAAPEAEWVSYPSIIAAFIEAKIGTEEDAKHKASAAIRDLSWQMAHTLTEADLAGFDKAIEVFASRVRSGGMFSYRLTPAGRIAAQSYMEKATQ